MSLPSVQHSSLPSMKYNTASSEEVRFCACRCGEHISGAGKSKSKFAQGHDQKFVSWMGIRLASAMAEQDQDEIDQIRFVMESYPNLEAKIESKAARTLGMHNPFIEDTVTDKASGRKPKIERLFNVKVGRWTYPAKLNEKGLTVRNTKRDGTGDWVRVDKQDVSIPLLNEALGL